jgi:hypothetical protein
VQPVALVRNDCSGGEDARSFVARLSPPAHHARAHVVSRFTVHVFLPPHARAAATTARTSSGTMTSRARRSSTSATRPPWAHANPAEAAAAVNVSSRQ